MEWGRKNLKSEQVSILGTGTLAVPKLISPNFGDFLRRHLASSVKKCDFYLVKGWERRPRQGYGRGF